MTIVPARSEDWSAALALLFAQPEEAPDPPRAGVIERAARGGLDLRGLLVARSGTDLHGVVFGQRLPGLIGLVMPPRVRLGTPDALADQLMAAILKHLMPVRSVIAFVSPAEMAAAEPLLRAGMRPITRVLLLEHRTAVRVLGGAADIVIRPVESVDEAAWAGVVLRSHEDSLDCPELNSGRTEEELLAGYESDPAGRVQRLLAWRAREAVGALLMMPGEIKFLGVVPTARRQGVGRALLAHACREQPGLMLSVDARNEPALSLYRSMGFRAVGERWVLFCEMAGSAGGESGVAAIG